MQVIRNTYSIRFVLPVLVNVALLTGSVTQADQNRVGHPHIMEAFTTTELPINGEATINEHAVNGETELHLYELDSIQRIESQLSKGLTADPKQSKRVVQQRLQSLDDQSRKKMQSAAQGLAKAMQYGVDRYPAIVFDGQAVVYGVTDVQTALAHYRVWRREGKR